MESIKYTLVRAKRRTVAVCIKDGEVIVKAPLKTPIYAIENFLNQKAGWIAKKTEVSRARLARYADVFACKAFLFLGKIFPYVVTPRKTPSIKDGALLVPQLYVENGVPQKSDALVRGVRRVYKRAAAPILQERLQTISQAIGLPYKGFSLSDAKTKWGSCDGNNAIKLNWRLILLDSALIDYVIVHELAHTVQHNHSNAFWALVGQHYPKYKEAVRWLKECGVLCELYA
ncbi:MAG: M48 family metallopeptidase [Clostridiales bacterium]|nr:M48 family metallopeptidase [Clostridiales bacterium]